MDRQAKSALSEKSIGEIKRLSGVYPVRKSAILMVLHVIFDQYGYVHKDAIREAASILELPPIDLEQAASFYTLFPRKPVGRYHIQVCRTLSCHLRGAEELVQFLKQKLNIESGGTTADGIFSLTEVECLGSCGTAPVMQINDQYYENLNLARTEQILDDLKKKAHNG